MAKAKILRSLIWLQLLFLGAPTQAGAKAVFTELQYNPHWYRTYDSSSDIIPDKGELLFNWRFEDAAMQPDSFYLGIDTLWALPQDVNNDTASDWDLQICPDEICLNGLKAGIHGANAPYPFGTGRFKTEHHFQFFPAVDVKSFDFVAPTGSLMGGMLFCQSRTTGSADTVLGFGAWKLVWDTAFLPPVRPMNGYLPKRSDFVISGDTVRYKPGGTSIRSPSFASAQLRSKLKLSEVASGMRIAFGGLRTRKTISIYSIHGSRIWWSGELPADRDQLLFEKASLAGGSGSGCLLVRLTWPGGEEWGSFPNLHR